jgi:hypothetical protein
LILEREEWGWVVAAAQVGFSIIEQDGTTVLAEIATSAGTLTVITNIGLDQGTIVLYNLHVDGPGAGHLGVATLRAAVDQLMESYHVEALEILGFRRTTGSRPGRVPRPIRFAWR